MRIMPLFAFYDGTGFATVAALTLMCGLRAFSDQRDLKF
jgi:hypothetical protein